MNRHERRAIMRDLQRAGCTCLPTITPAPRHLWPVGVIDGSIVDHQAGCVLGSVVKQANDLGILPAFAGSATRCRR